MSNNSSFYFGSSVKPKMNPAKIEKALKSQYLQLVLCLLMVGMGILWLENESKYSRTYEAGYLFIGGGIFLLLTTIVLILHYKGQLAEASTEINDYISFDGKYVTGYGFVCHSGGMTKSYFSIHVDDLCGATLSADGGVNIEVKDGNIFCKKLEDPQAAVFALSKLASSNK